jgi:hypothetical protein
MVVTEDQNYIGATIREIKNDHSLADFDGGLQTPESLTERIVGAVAEIYDNAIKVCASLLLHSITHGSL